MDNQADIDVARRTSPAEKLTHKFALSVAEAGVLSSVGRSQIYEAISSGELRAKKRGTSTLILPDDLSAWIRNLPDYSAETKSSRSDMATQAKLKKSREIEAGATAAAPQRRRLVAATPSKREAAADRKAAVTRRAAAE